MLDLDFIRKNPERVKAAVSSKHQSADVAALLSFDERYRQLRAERDRRRHEQTEKSKLVPQAKKRGEDVSALLAEMNVLKDRIQALEDEAKALEGPIRDILLQIPNVPAADVPPGSDSTGNVEVRRWGDPPKFSFKPKPHWDLCQGLGLVDFERATKISGSGFIVYLGDGARLERALFQFMLDLHTTEHGYTEVFPPFLVNRASMTGTGQLPKLENEMYCATADDLFLIPTAEVPVTNLHRDEILQEEALPIFYAAYSACFRREAGAAGRDTRGLIRVHQFDKVEMVKFTRPETSYAELESLVGNAEAVLQRLGLPYRVIHLCAGDLSFSAAKCYDIELWAPGVERWLEVSSCSNFEDFQARRMNLRYRPSEGKGTRFVHTLNGSGVALARLFIALLECFQREDGSVALPEVLWPYLRGQKELRPK
ncbi:MAG: serine--tRNA ligase [Planctomycetes bacterium]|nr:serine--tRNA ligase [Planctomycetota bacterium]